MADETNMLSFTASDEAVATMLLLRAPFRVDTHAQLLRKLLALGKLAAEYADITDDTALVVITGPKGSITVNLKD